MKKILPKCLLLFMLLISFQMLAAQNLLAVEMSSVERTSKQKSVQEVTLKDHLFWIEDEMSVFFNYDDDLLGDILIDKKRLKIQLEKIELDNYLTSLLLPYKLAFEKLDGDIYIIKPKNEIENKKAVDQNNLAKQIAPPSVPKNISHSSVQSAQIQTRTITGTVTDEAGEGLPGATVYVKGTSRGAVTDIEGNYRVEIEEGDSILVCSYIGFIQQDVAVGSRSVIDFQMDPDLASLEEVVVVGYGERRRADLPGSVAKIDASSIESLPVTSFDQALAGQAAGVSVQQGSGTPGSGARVQIRGIQSINASSDPLYVVDGYVIGNIGSDLLNNPLSFLSTDDIESITVLKDASSVAIYGSRANAGVVVITTKKGKSGKPKIQFDAYTGIQTIPDFERPDVMTAEELVRFSREKYEDEIAIAQANGFTPSISEVPLELQELDPASFGEGTNWFDAITRDAIIQRYNVSLSGGTQNLNYYISAGYLNQEGIIEETGFRRYTFRTNLEADINDKLKFGITLTPSFTDQDRGSTDPAARNGQIEGFSISGAIARTRWLSPLAPVRDRNGNLTETTLSSYPFTNINGGNPLLKLEQESDVQRNFEALANTFLEYEVVEGLKLRSSIGVNMRDINREVFLPAMIAPGSPIFGSVDPLPLAASATLTNQRGINWLNENTASYAYSKNGHNLNALIGFTIQQNRFESTSVGGSGEPITNADEIPFQDNDVFPVDPIVNPPGLEVNKWSLVSLLSRVSYDYEGRYYLTATFRRDGSSRFGVDNRWGNFPSISAAWNITNEDFFEAGLLSELKIHGAYGEIGNFAIGDFAALGAIGGDNYVFGSGANGNGTFTPGRAPTRVSNQQLTWESTEQLDVGIDFGFFTNQLLLSLNYYQSETTSLLGPIDYPTVAGVSDRVGNVGRIRNRGLEIILQANQVELASDFLWNSTFNFSLNRNKVLEFSGNPDLGGASNNTFFSAIREGENIGIFLGHEILGLWTQAELDAFESENGRLPYANAVEGSLKTVDGDEDGIYGENEQDRVVIGNAQPDFIIGFTNDFKYKNFGLQFVISGSFGADILNLYKEQTHNTDYTASYYNEFNVERNNLDRFRPGDDPTQKTVPTTYGAVNRRLWRWPNSAMIEDGTYVSVKNITLSYSLGSSLLSDIDWISAARIYLTVQNALLFTAYDGIGNPEVFRALDSNNIQNVNGGSYPSTRTFAMGFNVTF